MGTKVYNTGNNFIQMAKGKGSTKTNTKTKTKTKSSEPTKWVWILVAGTLKGSSGLAGYTTTETTDALRKKYGEFYGPDVHLHAVESSSPKKHFDAFLKELDDDVLSKNGKTSALFSGVAVKKVEDATPRAQLGDHVVMILLVERHTHVEYDVWVPHLVHNFYLLNKVNDGLLGNTLSPESFDRNWRSHPNGLENFAVAPTTKEIRLVIELKIIKVNVETEAVLVEGLH